ncbi:MAG: CPBP family intramembrane metalloprotease [Butyrivibrio sp.]|nr:CPBP family intramembrane metalloprotease [Butyrivibrio sp.]
MDYRKANIAYMFMVLATIVMTFLVSAWVVTTGKEPSVFLNNIFCELVVLIPGIAVVLYTGDSLGSVIPLKKFNIVSALLSVLYVLALFPLITLVNSISMLFVENTVDSISDSVVAMPMWLMLLSMGVISPFIEEVIFRGVLFQTYKKTGRIVASIVLSSVLFGMMHMNFNQFTYAAAMGVMFCILVEATGSVWSSFLAHGLFNSIEVIFLYSSEYFMDDVENLAETQIGDGAGLLPAIGMYFLMAVIFTPIALCIVYKIAKIEGREAALTAILKGEKKEGRLITFPLIIAIVFALAYMTLLAVSQFMQA